MAELRDFDPESTKDAMDALIHYAEETAMEALASKLMLDDAERSEIAQALIGIRPAVNALVRFIPRASPEAENDFLAVLCMLMVDLMAIGSVSTYIPDAQAHLDWVRVRIMQMQSSTNAQIREKEIRNAILEVCKGTHLKGSFDFAESNRPAVLKKLGVETKDVGYSASTLQKIICSILKEQN